MKTCSARVVLTATPPAVSAAPQMKASRAQLVLPVVLSPETRQCSAETACKLSNSHPRSANVTGCATVGATCCGTGASNLCSNFFLL